MPFIRFNLSVCILIFGCIMSSIGFGVTKSHPIAIVSALSYETAYLKSQLKNPISQCYLHRNFTQGIMFGKPVVIAQIGIGEINAAVGTELIIAKYQPREIILTGVAGGVNGTPPGTIVIADKVINYSFGSINEKDKIVVSATYEPNSDFSGENVLLNPLYFKTDQKLNSLAISVAKSLATLPLEYKGQKFPIKVSQGTVATTQRFINSRQGMARLQKLINNAHAVDMESAGMAQVAYQEKVPFMVIRAVSDDGNFNMFNQLKKRSALNAAKLIVAMLGNSPKNKAINK